MIANQVNQANEALGNKEVVVVVEAVVVVELVVVVMDKGKFVIEECLDT